MSIKTIAAGAVLAASPLIAAAASASEAHASTGTHNVARAASVQTFKNQATGACLEDRKDTGPRGAACTPGGSNTQKWSVVAVPNYRILKNVSTGRCLDDSVVYKLRAIPCNYRAYQEWRVKRWNDGTVRFQNHNTGRCLKDSGAGLQAASCDSSKYESWY